ncbi:hypothetical protein Goshw_002995 [Gossypium schwendimanii]|uniref:Uncharacterized protein n=1 Tax=Gossypium schwendimanii TaxID=34291 RepID=A0A7J9L0G3_GOSSC|nr:hypothetical protein [Gossypium schwendimanii]
MERGFVVLSLDDEEKEVVQVQKESDPVSAKEDFCLRGVKSSSNEDPIGCEASFEKGEKGHVDSFCQVKMDLGFEVAKMG